MTGTTCGPRPAMPARAGAGLKAEHVAEILETAPEIGFFEVHAENYMGAGGPPHAQLGAIAARYALSLHGVGLSIGGEDALDRAHLARLKALEERYEPALFSEHLAWSSHDGVYFNDLLPVAYDRATLARVVDHVDEVQQTLARRMLLENPSTYVAHSHSDLRETDFLAEVAARTDCGLLLDINNVHVSATNHGWSPQAYLDAFPLERVGEIHLAGHARERDAAEGDPPGRTLLVDAHDRPVDETVWQLFESVIARTGAFPTLIEWDSDIPLWPVLLGEADKAEAVLTRYRGADAGKEAGGGPQG